MSLIHSLAEIDSPDIGWSATLSGLDFPPATNDVQWGNMRVTDPKVRRHPAVTALTQYGPHALNALIDNMTNRTATRLTIAWDDAGINMGAMFYGNELAVSRRIRREVDILRTYTNLTSNVLSQLSLEFVRRRLVPKQEHRVMVGDVCFALVGKICNRPYEAVRYLPTNCIVVNSPIVCPQLAVAVRALWGGTNSTVRLYDSLVTDLREAGATPARIGPASRLLYYFPDSGDRQSIRAP